MKKLLILSAHPTISRWRTLTKKVQTIEDVLNSGKNANWEVSFQPKNVTPKVVDERIDRDWLETLITPYFSQGYDIICFHFSLAQQKEWGIKMTLRGANANNTSEREFLYFSADKNSKRDGLNRFIQTGLHEIAHGYYDHTKEPDLTHAYHEVNPDISGLFLQFDWSKWQPTRMQWRSIKNALEWILERLKANKANSEPVRPKLPIENGLQPLVERQAQKVLDEMKSFGYEMRITQGFRSIEEQNRLYAQGRTTNGNIVTNARGGQSFHNYGVAVDYVFRKQGFDAPDYLWTLFGLVGKKHGFFWGGDWKGFVDRPHLEMTLGHSLQDFQTNNINWNKYE